MRRSTINSRKQLTGHGKRSKGDTRCDTIIPFCTVSSSLYYRSSSCITLGFHSISGAPLGLFFRLLPERLPRRCPCSSRVFYPAQNPTNPTGCPCRVFAGRACAPYERTASHRGSSPLRRKKVMRLRFARVLEQFSYLLPPVSVAQLCDRCHCLKHCFKAP
jgi:hypothetical protein